MFRQSRSNGAGGEGGTFQMVVFRIVAALALTVGIAAAGTAAHAEPVKYAQADKKWWHDGAMYYIWQAIDQGSIVKAKEECLKARGHLVQIRDNCTFVNAGHFREGHRVHTESGYFLSQNLA